MNWSEMRASWNEMKALVQSHWPRLADVMLRDINGDRAGWPATQRQYGFHAVDSGIIDLRI